MDRKHKEVIKQTISRVNNTLSYYEKGFISVQRTPWSDKERCQSFEQFIEARFNFELCKIPEFEQISSIFSGKLFGLVNITEMDPDRRRFKLVTFTLPPENVINDVISQFPEMESLINEEIANIINYLGGKVIKFNNVKKKIKIIIENETSL